MNKETNVGRNVFLDDVYFQERENYSRKKRIESNLWSQRVVASAFSKSLVLPVDPWKAIKGYLEDLDDFGMFYSSIFPRVFVFDKNSMEEVVRRREKSRLQSDSFIWSDVENFPEWQIDELETGDLFGLPAPYFELVNATSLKRRVRYEGIGRRSGYIQSLKIKDKLLDSQLRGRIKVKPKMECFFPRMETLEEHVDDNVVGAKYFYLDRNTEHPITPHLVRIGRFNKPK